MDDDPSAAVELEQLQGQVRRRVVRARGLQQLAPQVAAAAHAEPDLRPATGSPAAEPALQRDADSVRAARAHAAAAAVDELAAARGGGRQLFGPADIPRLSRGQAKAVLPPVVDIPRGTGVGGHAVLPERDQSPEDLRGHTKHVLEDVICAHIILCSARGHLRWSLFTKVILSDNIILY